MKLISIPMILAIGAIALASLDQAGKEAHLPSQAAADVIRDVSGADAAFIAAGLVKSSYQRDNLASLMQYPDEEIVVLTLRGSNIRQALERSVSLYPQANSSFLQVSGVEVTFDPGAPSGDRIRSVTIGGSRLDDQREYRVAMPSSLGRGGFGYFKNWDKNKITQTLTTTVEKALIGKRAGDSRPRWNVTGS